MRKLIKGIINFHQNVREQIKDTFAQLALGQKPDALFIACSDSRVAVNVFASTDPGDLFVIRNVGNLVPPSNLASLNESVLAAIEFALHTLKVSHIIICGHSDCGAMKAIFHGRQSLQYPYLRNWLQYADSLHNYLTSTQKHLSESEQIDELSRQNIILQLNHLQSYDIVNQAITAGNLMLHGMWFNIKDSTVHYWHKKTNTFHVIDPVEGTEILKQLDDLNFMH
jgi:carbonic anhydrase